MVSRVDLLIAVIGVVVSVAGTSTAMWMTLSKKADRDDLARVESRLESGMEAGFARLDGRMDRLDGRMDRIESKLDALILRLLPGHLPDTGA